VDDPRSVSVEQHGVRITLRFMDAYDLEVYAPPAPKFGRAALAPGYGRTFGGAYDPEYGEWVPPYPVGPFSGPYAGSAGTEYQEARGNPFLDEGWHPIATIFQLSVSNDRGDEVRVDGGKALLMGAGGHREASLGAGSAYWQAHNPALLAAVPDLPAGPQAPAGAGEWGTDGTLAEEYLFGEKRVYPGVVKQGLVAFPLVEPEVAEPGLHVELPGVALFDGGENTSQLVYDFYFQDLPREAFERGRWDGQRQEVQRQRHSVWRSKKLYALYATAGAWLVISGFFTSLFDVRD
jgi:hypothetical protein